MRNGDGTDKEQLEQLECRFQAKVLELSEKFERSLAELRREVEGLKARRSEAAPTNSAESVPDVEGHHAVFKSGKSGGSEVEMVEHVLASTQTYEVAASTWDCTMFLYSGPVGIVDSLLSALACVAAFAIQLLFCVLVNNSMIPSPLGETERDQLLEWRLFTGHSARFYDEVSDSSLVSRVCAGTLTLSRSASQASTFEDLDGYLKDSMRDYTGAYDGRVLCLLCLTIWSFAILQELNGTRLFCNAVWTKASREPTRFRKNEEGAIAVTNLSMVRACCVTVFVILPRAFIAIYLGMTGTEFLAYTPTMADLLLNALALEFILSIDDILFGALVPRRVRDLQAKLEPIEMTSASSGIFYRFGFDLRVCLTIALVATYMLLMNVFVVSDFEHGLALAREHICDGNLDFVVSASAGTGVLYQAATGNLGLDSRAQHDYRKQAMLQLTGLDPATDYFGDPPNGSLYLNSSIEDVVQFVTLSAAEASNLAKCKDEIDMTQKQMLHWYLGYSFTSCADLLPECNVTAPLHHKVRTLCAETCGCADLYSGRYDLRGCSSQCYDSRESGVTRAARARDCADYNMSNLSTDLVGVWSTFFTEFATKIDSEGRLAYVFEMLGNDADAVVNWTVSTFVGLAAAGGCDFVASLLDAKLRPDPCQADPYYGDIRVFCPGSCEVPCPPTPPSMPDGSGGMAPMPGGPAPAPGGPAPAPSGPTPAPSGPTPAPSGPAPAPGGPTPAPGGPAPAPGGPAPAPVGPAPVPGGPAPMPNTR